MQLSFFLVLYAIGLNFSGQSTSNSDDIGQTAPSAPQESAPVNEDKKQVIQVKAKSEDEYARRESLAKKVISNDELSRYGDADIVDAMKRVPGVVVIKNKLSLVGLAGNYTQVLIDGELPRGVTINDLPMILIDRVEIYRSGNAEFSSQAIAGTINIILKKIPRTSQTQLKFNISDDFQRRSVAESLISDKLANLSYSVSIKAVDQRVIVTPLQKEIFEVSNNINPETQSYLSTFYEARNSQQVQLRPYVQYVAASGSRINLNSTLTIMNINQHESQDYSSISGQELPVSKIENKRNREIVEFNTNLKAIVNIFDSAKLDFSLGVSAKQFEIDSTGFAVNSNLKNQDQLMSNIECRGFGITSKGKLTISGGADILNGNELVAGWDLATSRANYILMDRRVYIDTVETISDRVINDSKIDELAFFVQGEWKFGKQSKAYLGARWESLKLQDDRMSNYDSLTNQNNRQQYNNISPIAQTLWQLNAENTDRVRLALSRAYQPPRQNIAILPKFMAVNASLQNPVPIVNYALRPELGWSYQASYEHNSADEWNYSFNASVKNIEDLHRTSISYYDDTWWISTVNSGHGLSKMLDIDTQFPLTRFLPSWPKLLVNLAVSKNWSRVSLLPPPDNRLSPISLSVNLGIDYRVQSVPLTIGTNVRYNDSHRQQVNLYTRSLSAKQPQLDFYALWKFDKKTQLRIAANNLIRRGEEVRTVYAYRDINTSQLMTKPSYRNIVLNFDHSF